MESLLWIKFGIGTLLLLSGITVFCFELFGVFRYKYVLNRMHAVAMGDTLALSLSLIGLMVISGFNFATLKLFIITVFLWFASPAASHLIARLEVAINDDEEKHFEEYDLKELEEMLQKEEIQ